MLRLPTLVMAGSFVLGAASGPPCAGQEPLNLPKGVIHVALPPGEFRMEHIMKDGKPLVRVSVGKTVIDAQVVYLGDGKHATVFEATKEGTLWKRPNGKGFVFGGGVGTYEPGTRIGVLGGHYYRVEQLKAGSIYLTTPSILIDFTQDKEVPNNWRGVASTILSE